MASTAVLCRSAPAAARIGGRRLPLRFTSSRYLPPISALSRYYASKSFPSHTVVSMPALSPTMTAGNIGTWQKQVGDTLAPGDVLVEIETDKAQMDFEFQDEGTLAKILKEAGEKDVPVGSPIAVMVGEGEDTSAFESFTIEDAGGEKAPAKSDAKQEAADASEPPSTSSATAPTPPASESGAQESESTGEKLQTSLDRSQGISPLAKELALEKGVPISQVKGTGPGGRITKADVEKFSGGGGASAAGATGVAAPSYQDTEASSMRKTIAARLQQSMNENPHFFVSTAISVTKLLKLRQALNGAADGKYKLSVNDFLVKACAIACKKVPAVNSSWRQEGNKVFIRQYNNVDISVAVATPSGLMTPIVKNVEATGLETISSRIKDLGKRARDGELKPEEYQGGTFTISNMGMNPAIERFTAVINPPQAGILAVGTTQKVAVPAESEDGTGVGWDDQINVTASFDHKVVDGAVGGEWIRELKRVVENPLEMML